MIRCKNKNICICSYKGMRFLCLMLAALRQVEKRVDMWLAGGKGAVDEEYSDAVSRIEAFCGNHGGYVDDISGGKKGQVKLNEKVTIKIFVHRSGEWKIETWNKENKTGTTNGSIYDEEEYKHFCGLIDAYDRKLGR